MNQSKKITEGALFTAIFMIMIVAVIFVPGAILLFPVLLPIPFIIYAYKYDWQASLIMLATALVMSFLILPVLSIPLTILASSGGITIGSAMKRKGSAYESWISGTTGFIGGLIFVFLFTQLVLDISWAAELDQILADSFEMSKGMMNQLGIVPQGEEGLALLEQSIDLMKDLIPVGMAVMAISMAFLSQWVGHKVINRIERTTYHFPPFRELSLPVAMIWIYLVALVLMLFMSDTSSVLFIATNNVLTLLGLLMLLQGLSFMFFYSYYKKWSIAIPIIGLIAILVLPFLLFYLVIMLGLVDLGFGLRDRLSKGKSK